MVSKSALLFFPASPPAKEKIKYVTEATRTAITSATNANVTLFEPSTSLEKVEVRKFHIGAPSV
jgi:phage baseplate assembly protein W